MQLKRKYKPRRKADAVPPIAQPQAAPETQPTQPPEPFTPQDFSGVNEGDKPKRKYTKRGTTETAGLQFGELTVFAGELAAKLSSLVTKQDAPLNGAEKQMLKTVGDSCGKFLLDGVDMETVAPKYAKIAVFGMLGLVVGVRALDHFMRPRLPAGQPASIAYDMQDLEIMPDNRDGMPDVQG